MFRFYAKRSQRFELGFETVQQVKFAEQPTYKSSGHRQTENVNRAKLAV
jgi:hypothetical protein